ncbi:MAG: hypothetical protein GY906_07800 [bacterium]|nr:hypothetical protein [bacterium]
MANTQPDLFTPNPAGPSGPKTEIPKTEKKKRQQYIRWKQTDEGRQVMSWCLAEARQLLHRGEARVSAYAMVEIARSKFHFKINNNFRSVIARDLCDTDPRLEKVIELRKLTSDWSL